MVCTLSDITVDCTDDRALAGFWAEVLGWNVYYDDDPGVLVAPSFPHRGWSMLFLTVPEGKSAKNRLHLDLAPTDRTRDEELERVLGLGARIVEDHRTADGGGWVYCADPEGNEFCIVRSQAERGPSAPRHYRLGEE